MNSSLPSCSRAESPSPAGADVAEVVKAAVTDVLSLDPADFDWQLSLAELGCDSINAIDLQFQLEKGLGVRDLGLDGPIDFDPIRAPLARLERHARSVLERA